MEKQDDNKKHLRHRSHSDNEKKAVVPRHTGQAHQGERPQTHEHIEQDGSAILNPCRRAHARKIKNPKPTSARLKENEQSRCPEVGSEIPKRTSGHQERQGVQRSIQESSRPSHSTLHRTRKQHANFIGFPYVSSTSRNSMRFQNIDR